MGETSYGRSFGAPGSGTSGAPVDAQYVTLAADATLTNESLLSTFLLDPAAGPAYVHGPPGWGSPQIVAPGANQAQFTKFVVERRITVNRVFFTIGTSNGNIDVGIYDATGAGGGPGARLVSSGSTACPAAGAAAVTVAATTLAPGIYWAAWMTDSATASLRLQTQYAGFRALTPTRWGQGVAFPLPANAGGAVVANDDFYEIHAGRV